jgi:hypothetical protein
MGLGVGLTTLPCKKENVEKPPRNQPDFVEETKVLSWAVEPGKEEEELQVSVLSGASTAPISEVPRPHIIVVVVVVVVIIIIIINVTKLKLDDLQWHDIHNRRNESVSSIVIRGTGTWVDIWTC